MFDAIVYFAINNALTYEDVDRDLLARLNSSERAVVEDILRDNKLLLEALKNKTELWWIPKTIEDHLKRLKEFTKITPPESALPLEFQAIVNARTASLSMESDVKLTSSKPLPKNKKEIVEAFTVLVRANEAPHRVYDIVDKEDRHSLHLLARYHAPYSLLKKYLTLSKINGKDNKGNTVLHYAMQHSYPKELIKDFIKNKFDSNEANDDGTTPLHIAAEVGSYDIFKELLLNDANADIRDKSGNSVMHFAAKGGQLEQVKYLSEKLEYPIDQENYAGETPLYILLTSNKLVDIKNKPELKERYERTAIFLIDNGSDIHKTSSRTQLSCIDLMIGTEDRRILKINKPTPLTQLLSHRKVLAEWTPYDYIPGVIVGSTVSWFLYQIVTQGYTVFSAMPSGYLGGASWMMMCQILKDNDTLANFTSQQLAQVLSYSESCDIGIKPFAMLLGLLGALAASNIPISKFTQFFKPWGGKTDNKQPEDTLQMQPLPSPSLQKNSKHG